MGALQFTQAAEDGADIAGLVLVDAMEPDEGVEHRLSDVAHHEAFSTRRTVEAAIEGAELDRTPDGPKLQGGGELHGIITAKGVTLGERAGRVNERLGEIDDVVGPPLSVETPHGPAQVCLRDSAFALVPREGRPGFRVRNECSGHRLGTLDARHDLERSGFFHVEETLRR